MRITYGRVGFELNANLLDSHSMRYSIRIRVDRPLMYCMQVAKMAGSLVSIMCSEIANMSISQVVIGYFN